MFASLELLFPGLAVRAFGAEGNLFTAAAVPAIAALVSADGVEVSRAALRFDVPVMIGSPVACLPVLFTGHGISRWERGAFTAGGIAYAIVLGLNARGKALLEPPREALLVFVASLVVITPGVCWAGIKERAR